MAARRQWVPIAIGVGILLVFAAAGGLYIAVNYFRQQLQVETVAEPVADQAFAQVRQQFGDRAPLIEWRDGRPVYSEGHPPSSSAGAGQLLQDFHVLAHDPQEGQLARFSLPFWLLRMKSGPIKFSAYASGLDDGGVDLRPEDIERYGPGIIFDYTAPSGERVLFWAQ